MEIKAKSMKVGQQHQLVVKIWNEWAGAWQPLWSRVDSEPFEAIIEAESFHAEIGGDTNT